MRWMEVAFWKLRSYVPFNLKSRFDSLILLKTPNEKQVEKMVSLGESIGLSSQEVLATYNPPQNLAHWRSRLTPLTTFVMVLGIIIVGFLIFALSNPSIPINSPPTSTYVFGSRYGTIRPDDFRSSASVPKRL
ncbi:MAG: hypothetical protein ACFFDQ_01015 [Candidatus Thorarchaeota archaeon]